MSQIHADSLGSARVFIEDRALLAVVDQTVQLDSAVVGQPIWGLEGHQGTLEASLSKRPSYTWFLV